MRSEHLQTQEKPDRKPPILRILRIGGATAVPTPVIQARPPSRRIGEPPPRGDTGRATTDDRHFDIPVGHTPSSMSDRVAKVAARRARSGESTPSVAKWGSLAHHSGPHELPSEKIPPCSAKMRVSRRLRSRTPA